jgi:hypothetical protein
MIRKKSLRRTGLLALAALAVGATPLFAASTLNVLWYTGGTETCSTGAFATYEALVANLATQGAAHGPTWNVTMWTGGAMPAGSFNVLVVASTTVGPWGLDSNPCAGSNAALNAAISSSAISLNPTVNRIVLTGQDADFHYNYGVPSPNTFDGPQGFLIDSIDWAGQGTGMGAVILDPGNCGSNGVCLPASMGTTGVEPIFVNQTDNVVIPASAASLPIVAGLSSAGLSNWSTSSHQAFSGFDPKLWTGITLNGDVANTFVTVASATTWFPGDVFASIGGGQYQVYHNTGTATSPNYQLVEILTDGSGNGFTYGCALDSASNLFTTNFSNTKVYKFDANPPHSVINTIDTNATDPGGNTESVLIDSSGNLYAGDPDGGRHLLKYDPTLTSVTVFSPVIEHRGTDWIDMAADQKTLFYTSEGTLVKRFDVSANSPLADFSSGALTGSKAFALRLLPPFDGSGGLLVADSQTIVRLKSTGAVAQTYDATCTVSDTCPSGSEDNWYGLNLDPNGTSFWAMDGVTGDLFRFNIASGAIEVGPISTGETFFSGGGVCVKGEPAAVNSAVLTFPAGSTTPQVVTFNAGDPANSHSWKAQLLANNTFSIVLTAHEVVCDTGIACAGDDFDGVNNYRCRWEEYFSQDPQLPIGIPYSHGMCVFYRVENPPHDSDIGSDIQFTIGYNDPPGTASGTPYCSTLTGGTFTTRFFRDPSSPPPADAALNHSFAFDITQGSVNESGSVGDPTISGDTTKTLNDYAVACRATTGATATWLKPAPTMPPTLPPTFRAGSAINLEVRVTSPSGSPITDAATSPNSMPLLITGPGGVSLTLGTSPGFWTYDSSDNWYIGTWKSFSGPLGTYTLCVNSTAFDYSAFVSTCTTLTLK